MKVTKMRGCVAFSKEDGPEKKPLTFPLLPKRSERVLLGRNKGG